MSWEIEVSDAAHEDLRDIYAYIALELRSPENARNVLRRILGEGRGDVGFAAQFMGKAAAAKWLLPER